jgi:hypothetical protein
VAIQHKSNESAQAKLPYVFSTAVSLLCVIASCSVRFSASAADGLAFLSEREFAGILQNERFHIVRDVKDIPRAELIAAAVIRKKSDLEAFIVNPGEEYQSSDSWVDVTKPARQLIVSAISPRYEVLCFAKATQGGPANYLLVVRRARSKSRVVFYAILDGQVQGWTAIKRLVVNRDITALVSAEHPRAYTE